jgi:hypothetical protein
MLSSISLSILIAVYCIGFYRLLNALKCRSAGISYQVLIWSGSIGLVLIWHSQIINRALTHWSGDSFYHLNQIEQFGLLAWSLLLIIFSGWISTLKTGWFERRFSHKASTSIRPAIAIHLLDIIITLALFELLYAFSPQFYYGYYLIIFDDLPLQWITPNEFGFTQIIDRIFIHSITKFSDLLAALTLWVLILQVIWRYEVSFEEVNDSKSMVIHGVVFGAASIFLSLIT